MKKSCLRFFKIFRSSNNTLHFTSTSLTTTYNSTVLLVLPFVLLSDRLGEAFFVSLLSADTEAIDKHHSTNLHSPLDASAASLC